MTQEQALVPFEALESFKGYTEEEKIDYIKDLLCIDENLITNKDFINESDMEGVLDILSNIRWYQEFLKFIYDYAKPLIIDYVEANKGIKVVDGKFTVKTKKEFNFSLNTSWQSIQNDILELSESRKQLETALKNGGTFDGKQLNKIESEIKKELAFTIDK